MKKTIKHQFFFAHPAASVWDYLTKAELMEQWLMKSDFQLKVGFDFQFRTNPIPSMDFDGIVYCKVLEIIPAKKLSYTWKSGPGNGQITVDTRVDWKLEQKENGTELYLEHSGFTEEGNLILYNGLNNGWLQNLQKIADRLNTVENGNTNA